MNREQYLKSLTKKELRNIIETIFETSFDPLGMDADYMFDSAEDEDSNRTPGFYCTHSGNKL
jgi:hypothetical protein